MVEGDPPYFSLVQYGCFVISSNVGDAQMCILERLLFQMQVLNMVWSFVMWEERMGTGIDLNRYSTCGSINIFVRAVQPAQEVASSEDLVIYERVWALCLYIQSHVEGEENWITR